MADFGYTYEQYSNWTIDNFSYEIDSATVNGGRSGPWGTYPRGTFTTGTLSYSNGVLDITIPTLYVCDIEYGDNNKVLGTGTIELSISIYLYK